MKKLVYLIIISLFIQAEQKYLVYAQTDKNTAFIRPTDISDDHSASSQTINGSNMQENMSGSMPPMLTPQIPAPPEISLPQLPSLEIDPAASINWRCRALSLANEYPIKKNTVAWALPISYAKAQSLLKQTIIQTGMVLVAEYDNAGQFLISLPQSNKKNDIIMLIQPVTDVSTLFKMHYYGDYRASEINRLNSLSDTMKNLLENHGLLQ